MTNTPVKIAEAANALCNELTQMFSAMDAWRDKATDALKEIAQRHLKDSYMDNFINLNLALSAASQQFTQYVKPKLEALTAADHTKISTLGPSAHSSLEMLDKLLNAVKTHADRCLGAGLAAQSDVGRAAGDPNNDQGLASADPLWNTLIDLTGSAASIRGGIEDTQVSIEALAAQLPKGGRRKNKPD